MRRLFLLISFLILITPFSLIKAQVLDGVYVKEHVPVRNPIPYTSLREADVMWSKKIIRQLDLKEKLNHPFYYPTKPMADRKSLLQLIIWGFEFASKTAYEFQLTNPLTYEIVAPITTQEAMMALGDRIDTIPKKDIDGNIIGDTIVATKVIERTFEVNTFIMKEEWFFDRQRSVMDVRIIGLAPMRYYENPEVPGNYLRAVPFWIYFPEFRDLFAKTEVFNPKNDAERRTYDDLFWKRKFSSFIIKESNVYNDRPIGTYAIGLEAMLEGEKVKDFIFQMEHNLWEY